MQIDWFTFVAQIINFLILIWLLKKFLFGPVMKVMEKRENKISSRLEEAKTRLEEAEKRANEYQSRIDNFEDEKNELMEEAKQKAELRKKELIENARAEVEKLSERWNESIRLEKESFLDELEKQAFHQIIDIVEEVICNLSGSSLDEQALETFLKKLENMSPDDRQTLSDAAKNDPVTILTATELSEKDKEKVSHAVTELVSAKTECRYETDDSLGFGLELRTNGWKLGWSMKSYLDEMLADLETYLIKEEKSVEDDTEEEKNEKEAEKEDS
ncbi:F0F1 ATP synthase subunit B [Rhodohalobacter mucosus]|uniref:ATP synthase subunit b n=1 Tax=Rhodohalobacter mucosus TaxID=2079485 RepID=A0A316U053_9BACT|nr:F0F1 ATP synthase subunit B [Rhodohalobacter mucosus]PWN05986.1 ATP synthase F0 subunit B [Rhodohalobacter mucosus]